MALFGKKKDENKPEEQNVQNSASSKEMDIILQACKEEEEERKAKIAEREFERALVFCGTGMGIHIAASKCPHVHAAVVESVMSAKRAITGNNVNVLAMGGHWIGHNMGIEIAEAYLGLSMGQGYEWWPNFYEFHKLAYDEMEAFNYEEFKANGFELKHLGEVDLHGCAKPNDVE